MSASSDYVPKPAPSPVLLHSMALPATQMASKYLGKCLPRSWSNPLIYRSSGLTSFKIIQSLTVKMASNSLRQRPKDKERQCAHCDRKFMKEEHLRRHERSHTGEKPFKCHQCHRRYGRSDVLARHLQTHSQTEVDRRSSLSLSKSNAASTTSSTSNNPGGLQNAANRPVRSPSEQHTFSFPFPDPRQSFTTPPTGIVAPTDHRSTTFNQQSLLLHPDAADNTNMAVCSPMPDPWNGGGQEWLNDGTDHDWHNLRPLPQVATSSMLGGNSTAVADKPPSVHATVTQTSICQIIRDQAVDVSRSDDRGILDRPSDQPLQHSIPTLPPPASAGIDPLLFDNDFNAYGYLSPGIMDYFEFPTPLTPISIPPGVPDKPVGQPDILFSVDQVQRMRKLWRSQRSAPAARIGRSLWRHTVHHQADNIFARPVASSEKEPNPSTHNGACNSGWGMDETCRNLLIEFCRNLEDRFHDEALADLTPHPQGDDSTAEPGNSIPVSPADGFPTREVLDASLDTFFQCSYLPFVHKATFDARTVPASLLLPMILIGLSSVYPGRSKVFVLSHQKVRFFPLRCEAAPDTLVIETYAVLSE